jgi:hypothetical protein
MDIQSPGCGGEDFLQSILRAAFYPVFSVTRLIIAVYAMNTPVKSTTAFDLADSFITHMNQLKDLDKARSVGPDAYEAELNDKVKLLKICWRTLMTAGRRAFSALLLIYWTYRCKIRNGQLSNETNQNGSQKEKSAARPECSKPWRKNARL